MKKVCRYILLPAALLFSAALAFTNGSAPGTTPWSSTPPAAGALYVSYTYGNGGSNQKIQEEDPLEVTTLKIQEILVSKNSVAKNESVTVAFAVKNTSAAAVNNVSARPVFYQTTGSALDANNSYVSTVYSAPTSIPANGTVWYVFKVTSGANRRLGRLWVDGLVSFNPAQKTDSWWNASNIRGGEWQSGALAVNYLENMPATLSISNIEIISPNAAANNTDKTLSAGQDFVISFNIQQTGDSVINGPLWVTVNWRGSNYRVRYEIGKPVTVNLNANTAGAALPLTVTMNNVGLNDSSLPGTPVGIGAQKQIQLTIVNPAVLNIRSIYIPTKDVLAYQMGPVTVTVRVQNTGGAGATVNISTENLRFTSGSGDQTGSYKLSVPRNAVYIPPNNAAVSIDYVITRFGGGLGICTVNADISGYDENSLLPLTAPSNAQVATFNVSFNANLRAAEMFVVPDPFNRRTIQLVVKLQGMEAGKDIAVGPLAPSDINITGPDGNANARASFNIAVASPLNGQINGTGLLVITYNITPGADAVGGEHIFLLAPNSPTASLVIDGSPAFIGDNTSATANYDPVSPSLIAANVNNVGVTATTDIFQIVLEFAEEMNTQKMPSVNFEMAGARPVFQTGIWSDSANTPNNIFTTATMNLTETNAGWVTVNLTAGRAEDLAGNTNAASQNIVVFFVDAVPPSGTILLNGGETITSNPAVTLTIAALSDNYSISPNMKFMIVSPDSQVAAGTAQGWLPYAKDTLIQLNEDSLGTKNIFVRFQDEAGNTSNIVSASIVFDTDEVFWIYPQAGSLVSGNVNLQLRSSLQTAGVDFFVSINNIMQPIAVSEYQYNSNTGGVSAVWNSGAYTARDAQLIAVVRKGNDTVNTGNVYAVMIDNTSPIVTVNIPELDPLSRIAYANGAALISGVATDNEQITSVSRVELSFNGSAPVAASGTDVWSYTWTVPEDDPVDTSYNVVVSAYDAAGNRRDTSIKLVKTDATPNVSVTFPPTDNWLNNTFEFVGTATSPLPLREIRVSLLHPDAVLPLADNILAIGTRNWSVTFDVVSIEDITRTNKPVTLAVTALTDTLSATHNFVYRIDGLAPVTVDVPSGIIPAAGTYNVPVIFNDEHSGISAVGIIVDNGSISYREVYANSAPVSGNVAFSFPVAIDAEFVTVTMIVSDNAYQRQNVLTHSFVLKRDYSLWPRGFASPNALSGYYVNSVNGRKMRINGWAAVSPSVSFVSINFVSPVTGTSSGWLTAQVSKTLGSVTANWFVDWPVPSPNTPYENGPDPHGTTYNVEMLVQSADGMQAIATTNAVFEKDIYGPAASFMNLVNGTYFDPQYLINAEVLIHTDGAALSTSAVYLLVDNVQHKMMQDNRVTGSGNSSWYFGEWESQIPNFFSKPSYVLQVYAVDILGNETLNSPTLTVRTVPDVVVTEPLPTNNMINGSETDHPIYATSLNYILFENLTINPTALTAYVNYVHDDFGGRTVTVDPVPQATPGAYSVSLNINTSIADTAERIYMINIIESDGQSVTLHRQPIMHDHTAPTLNVVFDGVTRYYPGAVIAPNEDFAVNVLDRTFADFNVRGSGFRKMETDEYFDVMSGSVMPTPNKENAAGLIRRSILQSGTSVNASVVGGASRFDPQNELLRFKTALAQGKYDLSIDVIDNAGNALIVTFNVLDLIVNRDVSGESGTLDKSRLITAYPNPYNPRRGDVLFTYYLKDNAQRARIMVYNQVGELVHLITVEGVAQEGTRAGYNQVPWDGMDKFMHDVSNGVYIYMIVIDGDKGQTFHKGTMAVIKS